MAGEFIRLDGYQLPILDGSVKCVESEIGPLDRAEDSQLRDSVRSRPRVWTCLTPLKLNATIYAIKNYVRGRGHHVAFDTSYNSDGGVGPNSGYTGCSLGTITPTPKFGTRRLAITSSNSMAFTVACPEGDTWTIMFWHQVVATGAWAHHAITKDGAGTTVKYIAGAAGATLANYTVVVTGTSGLFTIIGKNAAGTNFDAWYDDLVILPWAASAAQVAAWAANTVAFSPLPRLNLQGCVLSDASINRQVVVRGTIGATSSGQGSIAGTYYTNLEAVELNFTEVAPFR